MSKVVVKDVHIARKSHRGKQLENQALSQKYGRFKSKKTLLYTHLCMFQHLNCTRRAAIPVTDTQTDRKFKHEQTTIRLASSPGSPPPLCFICARNVRLNVGGREPGQLRSRTDTDDVFSVARAIHAVDTVHVIKATQVLPFRRLNVHFTYIK